MDKKRDFLLWVNDKLLENDFFYIISFLIILVIGSTCGEIYYNNCIEEHIGEIEESYSEEAYEYLKDVARKVIHEEIGIDEAAIPEDITEYDINYKDNEIVFYLCLNNNEGKDFMDSAAMEIKLSKNFIILSEERNFSSRDEYINFHLENLKIVAREWGITIFIIVLFIYLFLLVILNNMTDHKEQKTQNEK